MVAIWLEVKMMVQQRLPHAAQGWKDMTMHWRVDRRSMTINGPCNVMQMAGNNGDFKSSSDTDGLKELTLTRTDNHDGGSVD